MRHGRRRVCRVVVVSARAPPASWSRSARSPASCAVDAASWPRPSRDLVVARGRSPTWSQLASSADSACAAVACALRWPRAESGGAEHAVAGADSSAPVEAGEGERHAERERAEPHRARPPRSIRNPATTVPSLCAGGAALTGGRGVEAVRRCGELGGDRSLASSPFELAFNSRPDTVMMRRMFASSATNEPIW